MTRWSQLTDEETEAQGEGTGCLGISRRRPGIRLEPSPYWNRTIPAPGISLLEPSTQH